MDSLRRILITGGAGFLGSHLCDRLLERGCDVWCLDNLLTGSESNIAHLLGHPRFRFIRYDVCKYLYIEDPIDAVLHFASPASPKDYLEYPIHTLKVGAFGTHKALGLARAKGARFLLASTSEVYGDPLVNPQPEACWGNVSPISPRGVYDEAKRFAEAMTMAYHRYHGLDTRIVRIFNTYGPRMRPHDWRVVSTFIVQALTGRRCSIRPTGRRSGAPTGRSSTSTASTRTRSTTRLTWATATSAACSSSSPVRSTTRGCAAPTSAGPGGCLAGPPRSVAARRPGQHGGVLPGPAGGPGGSCVRSMCAVKTHRR